MKPHSDSAASIPEGTEYGRARAIIAYLWPRRHTRDRLVLRWNIYEARRLRDPLDARLGRTSGEPVETTKGKPVRSRPPRKKSDASITYAEASPREKLLADALAFYAEPETYFAIAFFPDPPCGDFVEDFEELEGDLGHPDGGKWVKPGKRAREALRACFVPSDGETA